METTLHRQLKTLYGPDRGGRSEVVVDGFRIDAVGPDGELIEVQSGPLGPLRGKLDRLLSSGHRVRVVKPVVTRRRVIQRARRNGPDLSDRRSPWRGALTDVFDDFIGLAPLFPRPALQVDVLDVAIGEVRVPQRRRRRGYVVADRILLNIDSQITLNQADCLWNLLPDGLPDRFTTRDLADRMGRSLAFSQRVAYCLRLSGAAMETGKLGNWRVYLRARREQPCSGREVVCGRS